MTTNDLPPDPPPLTPAVARSLLALLRDLERLDEEESDAETPDPPP